MELDLMELIPKKEWTDFSHRMIFHGRQVCFAQAGVQPMCYAEILPEDRGDRVGLKPIPAVSPRSVRGNFASRDGC